jgi:hypothetical protein
MKDAGILGQYSFFENYFSGFFSNLKSMRSNLYFPEIGQVLASRNSGWAKKRVSHDKVDL